MPLFKKSNLLPVIGQHPEKTVSSWLWFAVGMLGLLIAFVAAPLWLPTLRLVVPDRYIMAYAPEEWQPLIFAIDVSEQVPAPDTGVGDSSVADLLTTPLVPTLTLLPLTPGVLEGQSGGSGGGGSYLQPTPVPIAPTATATPASAAPVDSRAVDRERQADLSQADALLEGFTFVQQTGVNNCGPASIATMMSYWGYEFTLEEARQELKPTPEDPNVRPDELARFIEPLGYQMLIRENGDFDTLKKFILAGYPVMIESGYDPEPETIGWTSHFLTLVGYSEADGGFIAMDTYRRPNWFYPYAELLQFWRQFNRRYLVAYRPDQAAAVASIVGEDMDEMTNYRKAVAAAQAEVSLKRDDPYSWFNLGTSLVGLGRYEEAASAFDQARRLGLPWRFLWYQFGPFEAYMAVGRYGDVITLADAVLEKTATEEAHYYKGLALAAQDDIAGARTNLQRAVRLNPNYATAQNALDSFDDK